MFLLHSTLSKVSPTLLHRLCLENMILSFQASAFLPFCISFSLLGKQVLCLFDFVMPLFPEGVSSRGPAPVANLLI